MAFQLFDKLFLMGSGLRIKRCIVIREKYTYFRLKTNYLKGQHLVFKCKDPKFEEKKIIANSLLSDLQEDIPFCLLSSVEIGEFKRDNIFTMILFELH